MEVLIKTKSEELIDECISLGAMPIKNNQLVIGSAMIQYTQQGDTLKLDMITTTPEFRGQGHCKYAMQVLCKLAKQFGTSIELVCAAIEKSSFDIGRDIVGSTAAITKNKIPVKDLPKFYSKFGFNQIGNENNKVKMKFN